MYNRVGLALAFSPRCIPMLKEAYRIKNLFNSQLFLIHVGPKHSEDEEFLDNILEKAEVPKKSVKVIWEEGKPSKKILSVCIRENIDLLVAGALRRENIFKYYTGSIARKIIRKAKCSVLILTNPSENPKPFERVVINGTDGLSSLRTIQRGIKIASLEHAKQVHIFKEIKGFGLSMMVAGEDSEDEYSENRRHLISQEISDTQHLLDGIDTYGLRINVKVAAGKEGYELRKFTENMSADLMILKAPKGRPRLIERWFPDYLEIILEDLPSNLFVDHN